jgi:glycosyltransferase involved in cell wall biosynthesis
MLRDKGVREFVEAAGIVRQQHPAARFLLLGATDADNRSAFTLAQLRAWERSHGVEYLGAADDVRPHIAAAHCVVLPSYREGLPRTLLEAAAMARPTIATQVPGCRSAVEDGRTGLLCAARSGTALADACLRFLELPREAQLALGQAGRRKMEREFDQAIVVSAYRSAIAAALAREPAR